ncbi:MAG: Rrf2 family transcriptional regulator [Endomicrobiales bacterium]|nr:Rrf2 family transcriptional regulator [Endomicrobiales bacterium]
MKISFKGDYALKTILDLSVSYNKGLSQIKDIAKRQDIPLKYLEQIVSQLRSAGYLITQRGSKGGIGLAKAPKKITLGEIVRLMEGPTSPISCVSTTAGTKCTFEKVCVFRDVWLEVKNRINEVVDNTTFADMVKKAREISPGVQDDYSI